MPSKLLLHLQTLALNDRAAGPGCARGRGSVSLKAAQAMRSASLALSADVAQLVYCLAHALATLLREFTEDPSLTLPLPDFPGLRVVCAAQSSPPHAQSSVASLLGTRQPRSPYARQPAGMREGALHAAVAVSLSLNRALDAAMRLPGRSQGQGPRGQGQAIRVVQVLPGLLVGPVVGFAEGVEKLSLGLRNAVAPELRREEEERQRRGGLTHDLCR